NREEYQNTLNDLFDIRCSVKAMIPEDTSLEGFDNIGAALRMSPVQMQTYLNAADQALDLFFQGKEKDPRPPSATKRYLWKNQPGGKPGINHQVVAKGEQIVIIRGMPFVAGGWCKLGEFQPKVGGNYRFRFPAYAHQSNGKPITFAVFGGGIEYFEAPPGD